MKIPHKIKEKKDKVKKREKMKPKKDQVLVVAQEIKFARLLSGNEKKSRDKVLKTMKKWLLNCFEKKYEFKEDDFVRMWKGLFYAVWMSDKPLVQEELCESISGVLDLFPPEQLRHALLMFKAGLRVLATEWYGVDHHRMDKFLMLVRRYLRASLRCLMRCKWSEESCRLYANIISKNDGIFSVQTPRYARNATSMLLHITDCYLEEIAKVSTGSIPEASLAELLRPFCLCLASPSPALCGAARRVLAGLLRQSESGLAYRQATSAWEKMGCPEGGPEALELVSDDEEDAEQNGDVSDDDDRSPGPLDPRAGRVDVELPLLPVPANLLANMLKGMLATSTSKAHKRIRIYLQRFEALSRNEYPLRIQTEAMERTEPIAVKHKHSARELHLLDHKLADMSDELALRGLSRKMRKRLLAKSRTGASIVEDVEQIKNSTDSTNGSWQVEPAASTSKTTKDDTSNKENSKRKHQTKDITQKKKRKVDNINSNGTDKQTKHIIDNNSSKNNNKIKLNDKKTAVDKNKENNKKDKIIIQNGKSKTNKIIKTKSKIEKDTIVIKSPKVLTNKVKNFQKSVKTSPNKSFETPKKVKFVLKNNSMQAPTDYYKSIRQSPNIPFDGTKKPRKTNLKPSTPSPINPFFKKKLRMKN